MLFRLLTAVAPDVPVVTFSVFRFPAARRWQAFRQMGQKILLAPMPEGMTFGKMMGSGKNGFSLVPDFSQYALLACWQNTAASEDFFSYNTAFQNYLANTEEAYHLRLLPLQSHGSWEGENPFVTANAPPSLAETDALQPVVVLTRATIRPGRLISFWKNVPKAQQAIRQSQGMKLAFGIGELPLIQQATLSIWENSTALRNFAYQKTIHKDIVQQTRQQNWYAEDLFARFQPLATAGTYYGKDVLQF